MSIWLVFDSNPLPRKRRGKPIPKKAGLTKEGGQLRVHTCKGTKEAKAVNSLILSALTGVSGWLYCPYPSHSTDLETREIKDPTWSFWPVV